MAAIYSVHERNANTKDNDKSRRLKQRRLGMIRGKGHAPCEHNNKAGNRLPQSREGGQGQ